MEVDYRRFPILVVDDEPDILRTFTYSYGDEFTLVTADSGPFALELLKTHDPAVIVADQRMPLMSGAEFLERSASMRPDAVRIILTGYTDHDALVRAVNGARVYRYIAKPWDTEELRDTMRRAVEAFCLVRENASLVAKLTHLNERLAIENGYLRQATATPQIIGNSNAIRNVLDLVAKVASSRTTVLIEGETGAGKELIARAIHAGSPRSNRLFAAVNCAAIAESVLESELFGHRKGAFTDAVVDRKGLFDVADGGTVFLDEIGDTSIAFQAKFLRVLEDQEIRPVGDSMPHRVDVRVIAATNHDLEQDVKEGKFRRDLWFRLRVFPIRIPPLRERREDIPDLVEHLVGRLAADLNKSVSGPTPEALALLTSYPFPGNIRELANELERAILLAEPCAPITEDLLSERLQEGSAAPEASDGLLRRRTDDFERHQIEEALGRAAGVKSRAAAELGITYRGLLKKMQRLKM